LRRAVGLCRLAGHAQHASARVRRLVDSKRRMGSDRRSNPPARDALPVALVAEPNPYTSPANAPRRKSVRPEHQLVRRRSDRLEGMRMSHGIRRRDEQGGDEGDRAHDDHECAAAMRPCCRHGYSFR